MTAECRGCGALVTRRNVREHVEELLTDARRAYLAGREALAKEIREHAQALLNGTAPPAQSEFDGYGRSDEEDC